MSHETEDRRQAFQKSDLVWFLILPLLMVAFYFGYRHSQQSDADPNLRLVAKFSDDVSVELKGIAFNSSFGTPRTRWWKPNGLDFPEFNPNTSIGRTATTPAEVPRTLVFEINNKSETQFKFRTNLRATNRRGSWWSTTSEKESSIYMTCPVNEGYFASNNFSVEMATQGTLTVGHLTPQNGSIVVSVEGLSVGLEVVESEDKMEWEVIMNGSNRATELAMIGQLCCVLTQENSNIHPIIQRSTKHNSRHNGREYSWAFPKCNWTDIAITFTDYDQIAEFQNVSVTPGVITTPRVIGPGSAKE